MSKTKKLKLDNDFLKSIGLDFKEDDSQREMLQTVFYLLDMRLDARILGMLDDQQKKEYEHVTGSEELVGPWLDKYVPNFAEIAQEELKGIQRELQEDNKRFEEKIKQQNS